jgi:hypothetical protein
MRCAKQAHPEIFEAKQHRCLALAENQGMAAKGPAKKDFMQHCMQGGGGT